VEAEATGPGSIAIGLFEVEVNDSKGSHVIAWALANRSDASTAVRGVRLVFRVLQATGPLRMFRHGYQSWSPSGVATLGVDVDPSSIAGFEFLQAVYHADQRQVTTPGELRSEWVTLLADGARTLILCGFGPCDTHDGTLRLREAESGVELAAEAFFGDAVLGPGERRVLADVEIIETDGRTPADLLGDWAARVGSVGGARVDSPYQLGWCSWYQYFGDVTEADLWANLARAGDWPFEIFQLDDGYQSSIGDWLTTAPSFSSDLETVAYRIARAGLRPGLWLAPFLVAPDSATATEHPDWLVRTKAAGGTHPLYCWWNPAWGGGHDGFMYGLDTTHPEVVAHLEAVADSIVAMGFGYLKLDFTFSPSIDGIYADPSWTPAQRIRTGLAAIRRGAPDAFLLGCGVPLSPSLGVVDANRIGPDVAPLWALPRAAEIVPGYLAVQPATRHATAAVLARSFMHRRFWANDPDCMMLRSAASELSSEAIRTWARIVGLSGGSAFVSDDLSLLGPEARALFDEVVTLGRESDAAARYGKPAVTEDLLSNSEATTFCADDRVLTVDLATGDGRFEGQGTRSPP